MPTFRDLIFLAIDYDKQDIAYRLANLGADLARREKVSHHITVTMINMTYAETLNISGC